MKAWLRAHPLLRDVIALAAAGVVAGGLAVGIASLWTWRLERECRSAGNRWLGDGRCWKDQKECIHDGVTLPLGAKFSDGCNSCECTRFGVRCGGKYCYEQRQRKTCTADCAACVYEPGCKDPQSYCSAWTHDAKQTYCSCEGLTFQATTPNRPYQHVGRCD